MSAVRKSEESAWGWVAGGNRCRESILAELEFVFGRSDDGQSLLVFSVTRIMCLVLTV